MARLFNLIVSHEPGLHNMRRALREIEHALEKRVTVFDSPVSLLLLSVDNPFEAVSRLSQNLPPDTVVLRAIPLDRVVSPYLEDVSEATWSLVEEKASADDKFAIKLEGKLYSRTTGNLLGSREAIDYIASKIDLKVDLSHPTLLILIKIVRVYRSLHYAGVMVASPSSIFSRAKRRLAD